jgi:hypothetical protein
MDALSQQQQQPPQQPEPRRLAADGTYHYFCRDCNDYLPADQFFPSNISSSIKLCKKHHTSCIENSRKRKLNILAQQGRIGHSKMLANTRKRERTLNMLATGKSEPYCKLTLDAVEQIVSEYKADATKCYAAPGAAEEPTDECSQRGMELVTQALAALDVEQALRDASSSPSAALSSSDSSDGGGSSSGEEDEEEERPRQRRGRGKSGKGKGKPLPSITRFAMTRPIAADNYVLATQDHCAIVYKQLKRFIDASRTLTSIPQQQQQQQQSQRNIGLEKMNFYQILALAVGHKKTGTTTTTTTSTAAASAAAETAADAATPSDAEPASAPPSPTPSAASSSGFSASSASSLSPSVAADARKKTMAHVSIVPLKKIAAQHAQQEQDEEQQRQQQLQQQQPPPTAATSDTATPSPSSPPSATSKKRKRGDPLQPSARNLSKLAKKVDDIIDRMLFSQPGSKKPRTQEQQHAASGSP